MIWKPASLLSTGSPPQCPMSVQESGRHALHDRSICLAKQDPIGLSMSTIVETADKWLTLFHVNGQATTSVVGTRCRMLFASRDLRRWSVHSSCSLHNRILGAATIANASMVIGKQERGLQQGATGSLEAVQRVMADVLVIGTELGSVHSISAESSSQKRPLSPWCFYVL